MIWKSGGNKNLSLKIKSLRFNHVVFRSLKTCHKKITPTVVEMQQLPDI